jgi:hypothetical protein
MDSSTTAEKSFLEKFFLPIAIVGVVCGLILLAFLLHLITRGSSPPLAPKFTGGGQQPVILLNNPFGPPPSQ